MFARIAGQDIKITQVTDYPLTDRARIFIDPTTDKRFTIALRIPAWSQTTRVSINGNPFGGKIAPGRFLKIGRTWRRGDVIEVMFDMSLRLQPLNTAHPEMVAVMTGPLALSRSRHRKPIAGGGLAIGQTIRGGFMERPDARGRHHAQAIHGDHGRDLSAL